MSIFQLNGQQSDCHYNALDSNCIGITMENDTICIGEKLLLLNFSYFACRPCMLEIPYFNYLNITFKNKVDIVTILPHVYEDIKTYQQNIDTTSVFCLIRRLFGYKKIEYKIIPECNIKKSNSKSRIEVECDKIQRKFNIYSFPTTLLIDKKGKIRKTYNGFDVQKADSLVEKIEIDIYELLNE